MFNSLGLWLIFIYFIGELYEKYWILRERTPQNKNIIILDFIQQLKKT